MKRIEKYTLKSVLIPIEIQKKKENNERYCLSLLLCNVLRAVVGRKISPKWQKTRTYRASYLFVFNFLERWCLCRCKSVSLVCSKQDHVDCLWLVPVNKGAFHINKNVGSCFIYTQSFHPYMKQVCTTIDNIKRIFIININDNVKLIK